MDISVRPGVILYDRADDRCYLVLGRMINLAAAWKCIYRDEDGLFRIYYISDDELRLARDGIWKVLSGITIADVYLNSIVRGGEAGFETLKMTFDLADSVVLKMKYSNEKKENA